ncbi:MAG: ABC transporter ATP-binding protein [Firmicutes bacterium]|nr:ABC transporter ATP-binding protein [Bacillota bacterium]
MSENGVLLTENVSVGYGKKIVVDNLSFELKRGQILTLIGPNGVGKSTVLKTITAQLPAISGKIALCGRNLGTLNEKETAKRLSVLLTDKISTERMTCGEVAQMGRYPYTGTFGVLSDEDKKAVADAMHLTSVYELYDRDFDRVSDGQRQCVMLARAIAQQPEVLLLDEPTSFLDISHKLKILTVLRTLAAQRQTAVIQSLHEIDLAQKFSDLVLCVKDGRADRIGSPEEIFENSYISRLYGIEEGGYDTLYGTAEPPRAKGEPKVFVIGGGGDGINIYRRLQRQGIPFAAGVLHENDVEYPAARALACKVVTEKAFEPISEENIKKALQIMENCQKVICCIKNFGTMNRENEILYKAARETAKIEGS